MSRRPLPVAFPRAADRRFHRVRHQTGFTAGLIIGIALTALVFVAFSPVPKAPKSPVHEVSEAGEAYAPNDSQSEEDDNALAYWARKLIKIEDTSAQWVMMIFSIVAAVLLWETLAATRKMANDGRELGEISARAYLSAAEFAPLFGWNDQRLNAISINPRVVNTGQTPATITGLYHFVGVWPVEEAPSVVFDRSEASENRQIGSGNFYNMKEQWIPGATAQEAWLGQKRFYIMGWIAYKTVFPNIEEQVVTFCYEVLFRQNPSQMVRGGEAGLFRLHSRPDFHIGPQE